jgi:glutamate dehydrogenase/leucine dehydrogenase
LPGRFVVLERDELLEQDADVLVLAANSYTVNENLAARIASPLVVEGANLALFTDARVRLCERSIRVVPDLIASSSSAALVGHQMAARNTLDPDAVWASIRMSIERNTEAAHVKSKELNINSREAFRRFVLSSEISKTPW